MLSLTPLAQTQMPFNFASDWPHASVWIAIGFGVYLVALLLGALFKRASGVRLGLAYHLFCLALGPYIATVLMLPENFPARRHLVAACVVFGSLSLVRPFDRFFWQWYFVQRRGAAVPKMIREVSAVLVIFFAVLFVLGGVYHQPVAGLVAGSSVVGIVLGFAMQDTLGNVIAGFALQFGRPFEIGDWLLIENRHAQVIEINWRSTRFLTNDRVRLDVPNLHVVRAPVVNYHGDPGGKHGMRFEVGVEYDAPPNRVKELLARAAASAQFVLPDPAPNVFLKSFGENAIHYEVRYWISDHRVLNQAVDSIQTNIWYALRRAGISIPYPQRTLHVQRRAALGHDGRSAGQEKQRTAAAKLLRGQPMFEGTSDEHLQLLLDHADLHQYGRGEPMIREGASGSSMFVLTRGEAGVSVGTANNGTTVQVATLRRGDCFGEMSLLTGEPRRASVVALSDCEVLEITKPVFAEVVARDAELLPRLSELLARRQLETEGLLPPRAAGSAAAGQKVEEYRAGFLTRLKSFFEV